MKVRSAGLMVLLAMRLKLKLNRLGDDEKIGDDVSIHAVFLVVWR